MIVRALKGKIPIQVCFVLKIGVSCVSFPVVLGKMNANGSSNDIVRLGL